MCLPTAWNVMKKNYKSTAILTFIIDISNYSAASWKLMSLCKINSGYLQILYSNQNKHTAKQYGKFLCVISVNLHCGQVWFFPLTCGPERSGKSLWFLAFPCISLLQELFIRDLWENTPVFLVTKKERWGTVKRHSTLLILWLALLSGKITLPGAKVSVDKTSQVRK